MTETKAPYVLEEVNTAHERCPVCGAMDGHTHTNSQRFTCGCWMVNDTYFAICPRAPEIVAKLRGEVAALRAQLRIALETANGN